MAEVKYLLPPAPDHPADPVLALERLVSRSVIRAYEMQGDELELLVSADRGDGSVSVQIPSLSPGERPNERVTSGNPADKDYYPNAFRDFKTTLGLQGGDVDLARATFSVDLKDGRSSIFLQAIENPDGSVSLRLDKEP